MDGLGKARVVLDDAIGVDVRYQHACHASAGEGCREVVEGRLTVGCGKLLDDGTGVGGVGANHLLHLRQQGGGDEDDVLLACGGHGHAHGLGSCRGTVVHRGVADLEPREGADHALELEDVAERALADLGLIGGVGG